MTVKVIIISGNNSNCIWYTKRTYLYMYNLVCGIFYYIVTDLLWITATLFATVYSSLDEGDTPKFQLISVPVSQTFCADVSTCTCRLQVTLS